MRILRLTLLAALFIGVLAVGMGQQVITTTTTTVITLPGTTYTTTLPSGTVPVTYIIPKYTVVQVYQRPDQVCVIVLKPIQTEATVIEIPGGTYTFPGTTYETEIAEPTVRYTTTMVEGGGTTTTTGFTFVTAEIEITAGIFTTTLTIPAPVYGEIIESCEEITVLVEAELRVESVPATIYFAFPGMTVAYPGMTMTLTALEGFTVPTTTFTETRNGTTYTTSYIFNATTLVTTMNYTGGTTVIIEPGQVVTSTITYTTTIEGTGTTPTATETTATKPTPPPPPPPPKKTETITGPITFGGISLGTIIIAVSAVLILVGAIIMFFKR